MARPNIRNNLFDGITVLLTKEGKLKLERKRGVDGKRIKTDPTFRKTRENAKEFGQAGKAVKLLRHAFIYWFDKLEERGLTGRMVKTVLQAIKADGTNNNGERNLLHGKPEMLEGFKFNIKKDVTNIQHVQVSVNKKESTATVKLSAFLPSAFMYYVNRALYYRIYSLSGILNMRTGRVETDMQKSDLILIEDREIRSMMLTNKIKQGKTYLNFLAVGIEFSFVVNGEEYPMAGGSNDPLTIIKVIRGP